MVERSFKRWGVLRHRLNFSNLVCSASVSSIAGATLIIHLTELSTQPFSRPFSSIRSSSGCKEACDAFAWNFLRRVDAEFAADGDFARRGIEAIGCLGQLFAFLRPSFFQSRMDLILILFASRGGTIGLTGSGYSRSLGTDFFTSC